MSEAIEKIEFDNVLGFDIVISALPEYLSITDIMEFETEDEKNELIEKLDNYDLMLFCARVQCYKKGILLGSDFLGGCIYEDLENFVETEREFYLKDMIKTAISESKQMIQDLTA
ncbi:MAG: hypothetical protein RIC03_07050 [Cyclobacteriaceae bacterium]